MAEKMPDIIHQPTIEQVKIGRPITYQVPPEPKTPYIEAKVARPWTMKQVDDMLAPYTHLLEASSDPDDGNLALVTGHTWEQAHSVLEILLDGMAKEGLPLQTPLVDATPTGGLHLLWQRQRHFVVVMVPGAGPNQDIKWFASTEDGDEARGFVRPLSDSSRERLLRWLRQ